MNNPVDEVAIESFDEHTQQEQTQEILQIQQEIDKLNDIKQQVQEDIDNYKKGLNLCDLELKKLEEKGSQLDSDLFRLNQPSSRLNPDPLNIEFKQQELDQLKAKQQELNLMSQAKIRELRMREVKKIPLSIPNEVLVNEGARLKQQQDVFKRLVLKRFGNSHDLSDEMLEEMISNERLQLANYKNTISKLEQELAQKSELLRELRKAEEALECKTAEFEEAIMRYETVGKLEQSMKRKIQQLDEEGNIHQREIDKIRQNQLLRKDAEMKQPQLRQKKDSRLLILLLVLTVVAIFFKKNFE